MKIYAFAMAVRKALGHVLWDYRIKASNDYKMRAMGWREPTEASRMKIHQSRKIT